MTTGTNRTDLINKQVINIRTSHSARPVVARNGLTRSFRLLILFLILCTPMTLSAQQQVHGLVVDASTNEPMPFVTIAAAGSTYGTVSNQNGEFVLTLEKIDPSDNIAFHYLGYETLLLKIDDLVDGMIVKIKEKPVRMREITIVAKPFSPEELIRKALERKEENYPAVAQKREVFNRKNEASYISAFEITLEKSDIPSIDKNLIRELADSMPRYSRFYADYLYTLFTLPGDSAKTKNKIQGIKNVVLNEDDGGGLDKFSKIIDDLFVNKTDDRTFWKYKTGLLSFKDDNVTVSAPATDADSGAYKKNLSPLYLLHGDQGWDWDFIRKPNKYQYQNKGIIAIGEEDAYAISFRGKAGGGYQGMIYLSIESFAILRIEYSLKDRKKDKGFDLFGVTYSEGKDDGLLLYEKDQWGYFLKYSMRSKETKYGINRPFELIRKQKRTLLSKKINEVDLQVNLQGTQETCYETLVVCRERISEDKFIQILEKGIKPDRITSYSDTIWKGYSIIEPTRQMKEYKAKIRD